MHVAFSGAYNGNSPLPLKPLNAFFDQHFSRNRKYLDVANDSIRRTKLRSWHVSTYNTIFQSLKLLLSFKLWQTPPNIGTINNNLNLGWVEPTDISDHLPKVFIPLIEFFCPRLTEHVLFTEYEKFEMSNTWTVITTTRKLCILCVFLAWWILYLIVILAQANG
jgi:hypothetical protein